MLQGNNPVMHDSILSYIPTTLITSLPIDTHNSKFETNQIIMTNKIFAIVVSFIASPIDKKEVK